MLCELDDLSSLGKSPNPVVVVLNPTEDAAEAKAFWQKTLAVEPGNSALVRYFELCTAKRAAQQITLPSSIALELQINPFMRCTEPEVVAAARTQDAGADDAVSVLAVLRVWKNNYR